MPCRSVTRWRRHIGGRRALRGTRRRDCGSCLRRRLGTNLRGCRGWRIGHAELVFAPRRKPTAGALDRLDSKIPPAGSTRHRLAKRPQHDRQGRRARDEAPHQPCPSRLQPEVPQRGPTQEGEQQEPTLEASEAGKRRRDSRGDEPSPIDLGRGPPDQIQRQQKEEPERRLAHGLGAPFDELRVCGIKQTSHDRHAIVELPPHPTEQRQHRQSRQEHAVQLGRLFPLEP